jgi:hypothetical protein
MPVFSDGASLVKHFWIALSDSIVAVFWTRDGISHACDAAALKDAFLRAG